MAESYYRSPRPIQIGNMGVNIKVRRLSHGVKRDLRNYFSNYALDRENGMFDGIDIPAGAIEDLVVRRGLEELEVGGKIVQFSSASPIDDLPDIGMGDEEGDTDLLEEIIKTVVDSNRFLARKYPFNMVFAQYLGMVQADKREYEQNQEKETGAKPDVTAGDEVGPNPTTSPQDTPTIERIGGSNL